MGAGIDCVVTQVVHVLLVGFGKIKDDASYKFYENEGTTSLTTITCRSVPRTFVGVIVVTQVLLVIYW